MELQMKEWLVNTDPEFLILSGKRFLTGIQVYYFTECKVQKLVQRTFMFMLTVIQFVLKYIQLFTRRNAPLCEFITCYEQVVGGLGKPA